MRQTRWESFIEAKLNTLIGYCVSWFTMAFIVPIIWPKLAMSTTTAAGVVLLFTLQSVVRNYLVRRFCDWWKHSNFRLVWRSKIR